MTKKMLAVACACLIATPADAHWQFTKWGMTPAQVVAASKGTVSLVDPSSDVEAPYGSKHAAGAYSSNGRPMRVSFWFKDGKLNQINLASDSEDDCYSILRDLTGLYGAPVSRSSSTVWLDRAGGNRIQYSGWGSQGCQLFYAPIPTAAATGL